MEKVRRKISYIEGLIEGVDLKNSSKEGKVIHELVDVCKTMAKKLERIKLQIDDHEIYIEAIDEDLADLEELLFDEEAELVDEYEIEESDVNVETTIDEGYFEIECPHCEELMLVDENIFDEDIEVEVTCPECRNIIVLNEDAPVISKHIIDMEQNKGEIHYYSP